MNYWLDLFTGTTWDEFRKAGSNITGFSQRRHGVIDKIKPGDILLCYLTGVMRWVGALEVIGSTTDTSRPIWKDADFPVRFEVRSLILLEPEHGIPMDELEGRVGFFTQEPASPCMERTTTNVQKQARPDLSFGNLF